MAETRIRLLWLLCSLINGRQWQFCFVLPVHLDLIRIDAKLVGDGANMLEGCPVGNGQVGHVELFFYFTHRLIKVFISGLCCLTAKAQGN